MLGFVKQKPQEFVHSMKQGVNSTTLIIFTFTYFQHLHILFLSLVQHLVQQAIHAVRYKAYSYAELDVKFCFSVDLIRRGVSSIKGVLVAFCVTYLHNPHTYIEYIYICTLYTALLVIDSAY
jgi:hypothetical protein